MKELREFRAIHDVEARPEFKQKFDARISANQESIFKLLKDEGLPDAHLDALKKMSDDARDTYLEKYVYPNVSAAQRRFIESKLVENVSVSEERKQAIAAARADSEKIISEQREAPKKQLIARDTAVATHIKPFLSQLPYLHDREVTATATPAEKAEIEAHNKFAAELRDNLRTAIVDDSPEVRAEAALAVPISRALARQIKAIAAERDTLKAKLAAIDRASATGGRLGRSASLPGAPAPVKPATTTDDSSDVLDRLFAEAGKS